MDMKDKQKMSTQQNLATQMPNRNGVRDKSAEDLIALFIKRLLGICWNILKKFACHAEAGKLKSG
jgi:DUF1365 family protein